MTETGGNPNSQFSDKQNDPTAQEEIELEDITVEGLEHFKKKFVEDDRVDSIYRSKQNLTEKFDNRTLHPHGLTQFDYKSIAKYRRNCFEKFKHKTRHENYRYLGEHYELDALLALFFKKILIAKPQDTVHFAAEYFTREIVSPNYQELLEAEIRKLSNYRVKKMKAAQKICVSVLHELTKPEKKEDPRVERCFKRKSDKTCVSSVKPPAIVKHTGACDDKDATLNSLKKLNIGPLAQDFDTRVILPPLVVEIKPPPVKKKKVKKIYCGCKDPGRRKSSKKSEVESEVYENPVDENEVSENEEEETLNIEVFEQEIDANPENLSEVEIKGVKFSDYGITNMQD